ncbi:GPW/gp25 family protein [Streptomyces palmae]|nr:GPW/gp25 family protein [Streptomyces palmae]
MSGGTGMRFPFRIHPGGGTARVADLERIDTELRHLLASRTGDRVMLRDYGAGVDHRRQEPDTAALRTLLRHDIERSLRRYLPQVRLVSPLTLSSVGDVLTITFEYTVVPLGAARRLTLPLDRSKERR